jgi:ketosteroid isomerase-like protein
MKKLIIVLPLLLVAIGCTQSPPPADPSVIHARSAEWEAALNAGDVEAVVALYESDARLLPPNAEIQTGPDAVRAIFGGMIDVGLTGKLNSMETQVAGDYAYNVASGGGNAHLVITHEVSDPVKWLAAWRGENSRHQLFEANGAAHVHALQSATNPHLTGLVISVADMDALNAMLSSEEGQAAAAEDGVMADTMKMLTEAE